MNSNSYKYFLPVLAFILLSSQLAVYLSQYFSVSRIEGGLHPEEDLSSSQDPLEHSECFEIISGSEISWNGTLNDFPFSRLQEVSLCSEHLLPLRGSRGGEMSPELQEVWPGDFR